MKRFHSIFIMLVCCIFTQCNSMRVVAERQSFMHEVSNIQLNETGLVIKGWALVRNRTHLLNDKTHSFKLELRGNAHSIWESGAVEDVSLTDLMEYRGYPKCNFFEKYKMDCNYDYENVGFKFEVPLSKLKIDNYSIRIHMSVASTGESFSSRVNYLNKSDIVHKSKMLSYTLNSDFRFQNIKIIHPTVVARAKPYLNFQTPTVQYEKCSQNYGRDSFYMHNTSFKKIKSVRSNGLVKAIELGVRLDRCDGLRNRVVEGDEKIAFVQSNFVSYPQDKGLTLSVVSLKSDPVIIAPDLTVLQYDTIDVMHDVTAKGYDRESVTHQVQPSQSSVNTRIPGKREIKYRFDNHSVTRTILVLPIKKRYRYVSNDNINQLILWNQKEFKDELQKLVK
ncbi:hypothetical protein [Erysipelothrix aquatica]|uniref:hypothetical protein n=1 Tax=Erysipelothrix aquatica TaxID=2683714 RepID=UPI00135BFE55|nr:hypothetical protein [Erysipelothrix aquatica]